MDESEKGLPPHLRCQIVREPWTRLDEDFIAFLHKVREEIRAADARAAQREQYYRSTPH
jgi:hypothetical protein